MTTEPIPAPLIGFLIVLPALAIGVGPIAEGYRELWTERLVGIGATRAARVESCRLRQTT